MRYRVDQPGTAPAPDLSEGFLLATVLFTVLVGIGLVIAGRHGRQLWMVFWGWLTIVVCIATLGLMLWGTP